MKIKQLTAAACLAAILTAVEVNACNLYVGVVCPLDNTSAGIRVCVSKADGSYSTCETTDGIGPLHFLLPNPDNYVICVDPSTLPPGATIPNGHLCQKTFVPEQGPGVSVEFVLSGPFCTPEVQGPCWMTGGGNIGGKGGTPDFSYGGVVYPGCSPVAAGGGNWNVVDHTGVHFQGQNITVLDCLEPGTRSPRVLVHVIEFTGTGIITGFNGTVNFIGQATDNHDGGAGSDLLYLLVTDPAGNVLMQIGTGIPGTTGGVLNVPLTGITPATVTTGNIQIHQSSCGN